MATWEQLFGESAPEPPDGMVEVLRGFLQDLRERNRLLGGAEELNDKELVTAIRLSLDDWNTTPPFSSYTFETHPAFRLLLMGAAVEAHKMAGQVQTRNQLTYTDGGINVAVSDKTALNQSWLVTFAHDYETKKRAWKTSDNLSRAYGGAWSEYSQLAGQG